MPLVLRAKCVVVGDAAVGKSALVQNFISDGTKFPKSYSMVRCLLLATPVFVVIALHSLVQTTGVDILVKAVPIPETDATVVS